MSHRHKEAFFSHVGIQRLTKEAVCFINGSALRGPPNKRVSVSKCDLMRSETFSVFTAWMCLSGRLCDAWLLWMNVQRSHDCRDTGITLNPLGGSFILIIMSRDKCVLEIRFWFLVITSHKNILLICCFYFFLVSLNVFGIQYLLEIPLKRSI